MEEFVNGVLEIVNYWLVLSGDSRAKNKLPSVWPKHGKGFVQWKCMTIFGVHNTSKFLIISMAEDFVLGNLQDAVMAEFTSAVRNFQSWVQGKTSEKSMSLNLARLRRLAIGAIPIPAKVR